MAQPVMRPRLAQRRQCGQVLVFFALALPLVLLPIAAYAVDASVAASAYAQLMEVSARAAEDAAQQIDIGRLRAGGGLSIDVVTASAAAQADLDAGGPGPRLVELVVLGEQLRLVTAETVVLPFNAFGSPGRVLRATVVTRIASGYDSPSSRFPFPDSTF